MTGAAPASGNAIEKIMSISMAEYAASLDKAIGLTQGEQITCVARAVGSGRVTITFETLTPVRLGGLLELPRARVTLTFAGLSERERNAFLDRFDLAFQRGGG